MGTLFIVATPIGNLKDITLRAIEILKMVDLVVCEDSRVFGRLAREYQIKKKMLVMNDFNEERMISPIIANLTGGRNIALVSDAGSPLISDPGYKLVREAIKNGVQIESIPGPSAAIAALTVSGLPTDKFLFVGYLPKKEGKRNEILVNLKEIRSLLKLTLIFYESRYRLVKTLENIKGVFGDIDLVICREMTKIYEEIRRGKVSNAIKYFSEVNPKGEFTLLF